MMLYFVGAFVGVALYDLGKMAWKRSGRRRDIAVETPYGVGIVSVHGTVTEADAERIKAAFARAQPGRTTLS